MKRKTARQIYIEMLRHRVDGIDSASPEQREHILWADLIAGGYLNGVTRNGPDGIPTGNVISGPTVKGRLFLQELEALEAKETTRAKILRYGVPAATFVLGALWSLFTDWFKKKLGL
jgi:hypothetical protein